MVNLSTKAVDKSIDIWKRQT